NQVHVASPLNVFRAEIRTAVVGGEATDAEIIQQLLHLRGLSLGPVEIRRIKFDALVPHLSDSAYRAHEIIFQCIADGIQLETERNRCRSVGTKGPGKR